MHNSLGRVAIVFAVSLLCNSAARAGAQSADSGCTLAPPTFIPNAPNIFNDQQEQYLGDAMAEETEADLKLVPPGKDDQLTRIGERLLAALPPSGLRYRFRIYDSGELNAFSLGGGRVYISRKLLAAIKNEDELAGVVAHEIGHISTHQFGVEFTRVFRIRLGVTQVTDRADIFAKVHLMLSTPAKPAEAEDNEQKDQLLADHAGLYAMVRAGYAPESFASFLDKITMNKGKTSNAISEFFGFANEASQRYRRGLKLIAALPANCKLKQPGSTEAFLAWQRSMVEERVKSEAAGNIGDRPLRLDPPLRPSLWRIRFSPDGRYVLGQDEGGISVADANAAKFLFRIDAPDAQAAQFTSDSQRVVFHDTNLRVEQWSVAKAERIGVKEMVVLDGCNQTMLAPDGNTLICANINVHADYPRISLRIIDVDSGRTVYEKPEFYGTNMSSSRYTYLMLELGSLTGVGLVNMLISPDGHYFLAAAGSQVLAFDLDHRQLVSLGGKLKELSQERMSFMGPNELFVVGEFKGNGGLYKAQVLSFPDGRLIRETQIGPQQIEAVTKGEVLIARPLKDYAVGILDPEQGKFVGGSKFPAMDVWDQQGASEEATGGLVVGLIGAAGSKKIPLPLGPLPKPQSALFSPDGKYLLVSLRNRAELWSMETGKQMQMIRPFRSAWMNDAGHLFAQFPKFMDKDPVELEMTLSPLNGKDLAKYEDEDWQYHNLELRFKPMGKDKSTMHHATLEAKDMQTQKVAWQREYQHETPAIWSAEDNRLVLAWDLSNDAAKLEIKNLPNLQHEKDSLKSQKSGLLIETVMPETGAALQQVVIPEADMSHGWRDVRRAAVSGEYVLVRGEHGNTVIYRLDSGVKVGEFFGTAIATDAGSHVVVAINRDDEVLLVDERSGKELERFTLGSPVRLARIVTSTEKALLVLTADQVVHRLPVPDDGGNSASGNSASGQQATPE